MSHSFVKVTHGAHFSALDIGGWQALQQAQFVHAAFAKPVPGKFFPADALQSSGAIVSLNVLPPHSSMPFFHRHQQLEELYLFVQGRGQFWLDEQVFEVQAGSLVRVAPAGVRCWRNHSAEPLYFVVLQVVAGSLPGGQTIEDGVRVDQALEWPA